MRRLIKKANGYYIHLTTDLVLKEILEEGLLVDQTSSVFVGQSIVGDKAVYFSRPETKSEKFDVMDYNASVMLEVELNSNDLLVDPAYFYGDKKMGESDILTYVEAVVQSEEFEKYKHLVNYDSYDDLDDFYDEEFYNIVDLFYENDGELIKAVQDKVNIYFEDYVYFGNVPPNQIKVVHLYNDGEISTFTDLEELKNNL